MARRPFIGGYRKDRSDRRDALYAWSERPFKAARIKREVNLWLPNQRILSQGRASCTGYAGAYALRAAIAHSTGKDPGELSGDFLYYTGRSVWGGEDEDNGSYIRTLFQAIQIQGACRAGFHRKSLGPFKKPSWKAVKNGFKHRGIRNYRRIATPDEARQALSEGIPLVGGWGVGKDFMQWRGGEAFSKETRLEGGHALAIFGYNRNGDFLSPNSWGTRPGESGWWRLDEKFLMSSNRLWACDTRKVR